MATTSWRYGTLVCLLCGQVAATIAEGNLQLVPGARPLRTPKGWRCERCSGALYVERALDQMELPVPNRAPRRRYHGIQPTLPPLSESEPVE